MGIKHSFWQRIGNSYLCLFTITFLFITILQSEEVCKFAFKGRPEIFKDSTMTVPDEMVALSEYQYVHGSKDITSDTLFQPAIMFVVDYSGSMQSNDPENARVLVPSALIDSLMEKCPLAEVGISLWSGHLQFDRPDDPYNVECPGEPGQYCPLFQLNKRYPPDNWTGYEILKWYLRMGRTYLAYIEETNSIILDGTHITAGVNATKHAFSNTQRVRASHFNIFFSDGEPTKPVGDLYAFVPGKEVATTFTVFFGDTAPQCLKDFTQNVKNNGYSPNNPKGDLWSIQNVGKDTLLNFVMKNVMNNILMEGYQIPFKMTVNGGTPVENWHLDSTGFTFPHLFPLEDWTTNFVFDIDYHCRIIIIDQNNGTIDTIDTDTIHNVPFKVTIDPNQGELPDSLWDVKCWDRQLSFYYNGNPVTNLTEEMNPLEIRFSNDPGEAKYEYSKVSIEICNTEGNAQDQETIDLQQNGQTFTGTIEREMIADNESPDVGDGTLQHYANDFIIAVFRNDENPKLTLDTLKIKTPFEFSGALEVDKAYYYDNNADGYVDSILCEFTSSIVGNITKDHIKELLDNSLNLPDFREFKVNDYNVDNDKFYLLVDESTNHDPFTYITKDDNLALAEYVFSTGGIITKKDVVPEDRVAPLIHWNPKSAYLIDNMIDTLDDTLFITFSETVERVTAELPFFFLDVDNDKEYEVRLKDFELVQDKKRMVFKVLDFSGVDYMEHGDSVWIRGIDRVTDTQGNCQNDDRNPKRMLYVTKRIVPYTLIPEAVTPVNPKLLTKKNEIPWEIEKVLKDGNIFDELQLPKGNEKYHGMIIMAVPHPKEIGKYLLDLEYRGSLSIYDALGNTVVSSLPMSWWHDKKSLVTVWNMKNDNGRVVTTGTYISLIVFEDVTESMGFKNGGPEFQKSIFLGVKH